MSTFEAAKKEIQQFLDAQEYVSYVADSSVLDALLRRALELDTGLSKDLTTVDYLISKLKSTYQGTLES